MNPDSSNTAAAVEAGRLTATPHKLEPGYVHAIATRYGVEQIDLTHHPRELPLERKTGVVAVHDTDSFGTYWGKHATNASEIYANLHTCRITAVLDAHSDQPDWGHHRLIHHAEFSPAFTAWYNINGQQLGQQPFAEHIEDRRPDIIEPAAADMIELAQTLQGTTNVTWGQSTRLPDGTRKVSYAEEATNVRGGRSGELEIPAGIKLQMPIFDRAANPTELTARFRYRITRDGLTLGIKIDQLDEVITAAFEEIIAAVAAATGATVMRGTPPDQR